MLELITDWSPLARGIIAFVIAFGVSLAIGNKVILKLVSLKIGQPVRSKEEINKLHELHGGKAGTPTMGGVMILFTLVLATLLAADLTNPFVHICLFVLLGLGALGFKDDWAKVSQGNSKGVSSKFKLVWQFGVAAFAALWIMFHPQIEGHIEDEKKETVGKFTQIKELSGEMKEEALVDLNNHGYHKDGFLSEKVKTSAIYVPGFKSYIPLGFLALGFFIVVVVGASNAVNLTDGLDGLASGVTITTALAYIPVILLAGAGLPGLPSHHLLAELNVFVFAMIGAVAGFLWFNTYPARMFMGDTGSLALGGAIGAVAICSKQEIILVLIGLVFVLEALSVMFQVSFFKFTKKKFGEGRRLLKCAPLHHHFELSGWKETTVIVRFWIISAICAGLGLAILFI